MKNNTIQFMPLLEDFISKCKKGIILQKSGKPISHPSIKNYEYLKLNLERFSETRDFGLRIISSHNLSPTRLSQELTYWKRLYDGFSNFLYKDRNCYDNYVGRSVKSLRSFLNYLQTHISIHTEPYKQSLYVRSENIQIVVLTPERLNFLIRNREFVDSLPERLKRVGRIYIWMYCSPKILRFDESSTTQYRRGEGQILSFC